VPLARSRVQGGDHNPVAHGADEAERIARGEDVTVPRRKRRRSCRGEPLPRRQCSSRARRFSRRTV
jgi:hypothetical protein